MSAYNINYTEIREELKKFHSTSTLKGLVALLKQYLFLAIGSTITLFLFYHLPTYTFIPLYVIMGLILASGYFGFFILLHEASHNNLFKSKYLNKKIDFMGAFLIFQSFDEYRKYHKLHHRFVGENNDPERELEERWVNNVNKGKMYFYRAITLYYSIDFLKYQFLPFWISKRENIKKILYFASIILLAIFMEKIVEFTLLYIIPIFIFYPFIYFLGVVHEHLLLPNQDKNTDFFGVTRNNIKGVINKYFLHRFNDGYHSLHHFDSAIPYYNLPDAHRMIKSKYNIAFLEESLFETINT